MKEITPKERGYQMVNGYAKPFSFVYEDSVVVNTEKLIDSQPVTNFLIKIEYPIHKGMHWILTDAKYSFNGSMPDDIDWLPINQAKKLMVETLKLFKTKQFLFIFLFTWNKTKFLNRLLLSYNETILKGFEGLKRIQGKKQGIFIKPEYQTPIAYEVNYLCKFFLKEVGIEENVATNFAKIISHVIEYDNAYRLYIMDIMSRVSKKNLMDNPLKEIDRIAKLMVKYPQDIYDKFNSIKRILKILLIIPKYKKAFHKTIELMNIEKLQYTESDRYWAKEKGIITCID